MSCSSFPHVTDLVDNLSSCSEGESDLTSLTEVQNRLYREETSLILNAYKGNTNIQNLKHWISCPYIHDGAIFICRIIRHGLNSSTTSSEKLNILVEIEAYLRLSIIGALKSVGGTTPQCPTPDVLDLQLDDIAQEAISQTRVPGYDLILLERDQFTCKVTGRRSLTGLWKLKKLGRTEKFEELKAEIAHEVSGGVCTEEVHIIPFKLGSFTKDKDTDHEKMAAWQALYHVFPEIRDLIDATSINKFQNAMTMEHSLHCAFGAFKFGLSPMGDHRYHLIVFDDTMELFAPIIAMPINEQGHREVEFRYSLEASNAVKVSDVLLRVHLAVCHVFHMTGGAEAWECEQDPDKNSQLVSSVYDGSHSEFASALTEKLLCLV